MSGRLEVMLVDDDDDFWLIVERLVTSDPEMAAAVHMFRMPDGPDAIDYLAGHPGAGADAPWPDVILLDQRMPLSDGTEVLAQLKADARTRSIPVCMLSSSDQSAQLRESYDNGASFCITKPLALDDLRRKLRAIAVFFRDVVDLPPNTGPPA